RRLRLRRARPEAVLAGGAGDLVPQSRHSAVRADAAVAAGGVLLGVIGSALATLGGRFVLLRPLAQADDGEMQAVAAGPRETFTWTHVPTPEEVPEYVTGAVMEMEARRALVFATCLASGELVGCTRFF